MRRGEERGGVDEPEAAAVSGRRTFLGVGIGCALPLIAGTGLMRVGGVLASGQDVSASDPVWEHIASEAWRACQEVQGPFGVRGEHVRRLASQTDLFAVHLRGRGLDQAVDDEVERLLRERGREGAALEILDHYHDPLGIARRVPHRGTGHQPDPASVAACLDRLRARGTVTTLRARRGALERAAARLDRQIASGTVRLQPAMMDGQKPGDDFQGLPDPQLTPEDLCRMLDDIVAACTVLMAALELAKQGQAAVAIGAIQALAVALIVVCCRSRAE
jgi:hypothetical protein